MPKKKIKIEVRKVKDGFRWRAISPNGNIMANGGQGYSRKVDLTKSLQSLATAIVYGDYDFVEK